MRLIIDTLIALMLVLALAGIILHFRQEQFRIGQCRMVQQSLLKLQETTVYRRALGEADLNVYGNPATVSPLWFTDGVPTNFNIPGRHPWIDMAPSGDMGDNPPDPVITRPEQAGFWYNPNRGIFRARVSPQFTDNATLDLYNLINGTAMASLPVGHDLASRTPVPGIAAPIPGADAGARTENASASPPVRKTLRDDVPG